MRKLLFFSVLLILCTSNIFSQESEEKVKKVEKQTYYLLEYPESYNNFNQHTISSNLVIPANKEFYQDYFGLNLGYTYENLYNKASAGIQTSKSNTKFFLADTFWFANRTKLNTTEENSEETICTRFGFNVVYNFNYYNNLVTYNNILFGVAADFILTPDFSINSQLMFDVTLGTVHTDKTVDGYIYWTDFAFKVTFLYHLPVTPDFKIYLDMANYDDFTFQRFYAPIITAGVKYTSPYGFAVGLEANLHYTDIFSFSRYLEYAAFTIKGEYKL